MMIFYPAVDVDDDDDDDYKEVIASLSNHDDEHNDDFKKTIGLMIKTTAQHVHHAF